MADRATVFIDGNNWYHALKKAAVPDLGDLDYAKISQKLLGPRTWVATRYYIGRVRQQGNAGLYAQQRRFLSQLTNQHRKISAHLGRLEPRKVENPAAVELSQYLHNLKVRIDRTVFQDLVALANRHRKTEIMVEKAVDVMLSVDMVLGAERNQFDAAYLLSADGDFTPVVQAVKQHGKKVYVASAASGAQLASCVDSFIPLDRHWFLDCYA